MRQSSKPVIEDLIDELDITASRSSGPGGQNVNKVNSKIMIRLDIGSSTKLTPAQKNIIRKNLHSKVTKDDQLLVTAEEDRSQLKNKEKAIRKLDRLLTKAFSRKKKRKPTKPGKAAIEKRLKSKKKHAEKKKLRKNIF